MDPTDEAGITEASARYLVAAFRLWAARGQRVSTGEVAERLAVKPPSATDMLGKLADAGYLDHSPHRGVEPTPRGVELARVVSWRQCVVESFFDDLGATLGRERALAVGCRLPADAVDRLGSTSDHDCRDRCRAGEAGFDGCLKLAGVETV